VTAVAGRPPALLRAMGRIDRFTARFVTSTAPVIVATVGTGAEGRCSGRSEAEGGVAAAGSAAKAVRRAAMRTGLHMMKPFLVKCSMAGCYTIFISRARPAAGIWARCR
jgi:hypothetical protein